MATQTTLTYETADEQTAAANDDRVLLEGPHSRTRELWLVLRTIHEFIMGFRALHFVGPCVTVFGSARIGEADPYYAIGRELGRRIARLGFTVMTGGGPGLMEAANRGARDAGGRSVGCNIKLPAEQAPNRYLDRWVTCRHFFVRKVLLFKYSYAFVALPGGIGTMDELFEALTLIQTRKIEHFPIILIGAAYWRPLVEFLERMIVAGTIHARDIELLHVTDSLDEAIAHLDRCAEDFGLRRRRIPAPSRWLGESAGIATATPSLSSVPSFRGPNGSGR
ncbi:MAG TPA: TIGR00730 family Rossman fold protein [Vicinamibacterales bacterium]|nr:TIGR00730 family Rossman fold protein [Vicinamibacterales bacterium]